MPETIVERIHHYCSPSTFLSIIQKKELWLTSLTQSNDAAEGQWILSRWLDTFREQDQKKRIQGRGARLTVETTLRDAVALGTCFSEADDQLSQWRGYASDGAGFAVTFDRREISDALNSTTHRDLMLEKVSYGSSDYERRNDLYRSLSGAFSHDYHNYSESSDGMGGMSIDNSSEARALKLEAVRKLFLFKNPAFREEKEWRILLVGTFSGLANVEYREARGIISPYLRLKVPAEAIRRVTLGPTNKTPLHLIEALLRQSGISADVERSSASYLSR